MFHTVDRISDRSGAGSHRGSPYASSATVEHVETLPDQRYAVKAYFPRNIYSEIPDRASGELRAYFSELLTALKRPLRELPTPETAAMMVRLMPAAISAYSIAVAPD